MERTRRAHKVSLPWYSSKSARFRQIWVIHLPKCIPEATWVIKAHQTGLVCVTKLVCVCVRVQALQTGLGTQPKSKGAWVIGFRVICPERACGIWHLGISKSGPTPLKAYVLYTAKCCVGIGPWTQAAGLSQGGQKTQGRSPNH